MNVFEAVKQSVTTRQAAEAYGIRVNRNGMCVCPFHNDRTPSMKVDRRFHCFGCQADGDVIDFTAKVFDMNSKGAAVKLAADFGIPYEERTHDPPRSKPKPKMSAELQFRKTESYPDLEPNHLTRKLNANVSELYNQFGISYTQNKRYRDKRTFTLKNMNAEYESSANADTSAAGDGKSVTITGL